MAVSDSACVALTDRPIVLVCVVHLFIIHTATFPERALDCCIVPLTSGKVNRPVNRATCDARHVRQSEPRSTVKIFACLDQISPLGPMSEAGYTMVGQAEQPNNELAPPESQEGASKVRFTFK